MRALINTLLALAATSTTAFAANSARADEPGILCWAFLGFCAVIFAGQIVPSVMMLFGIAKGIFSKEQVVIKSKL